MAIVLKYGPVGPILQTGFAAGVGHRKNAQTEDALKIWQQQQAQAFQGQQDALHRQQQVGLQQQAQNFQADQHAQQQYAQVLGKRLQAGQADLTRQQQQKHYDDMAYQATQKGLANGDLELPGSAQMELKKLDEGRVLVQGAGWTDQDRAQFEKDYQDRKRALTMLASPVTSPAAAANRDTVHRDKTGKAYDQPVEGVTSPYSLSSGKPIEDPQAVAAQKAAEVQAKQQEKAQVAQQKQQEKAQAEAAKQAEKIHADQKEYSKTLHAEMVRRHKLDMPLDGTNPKALESYAEEAKKGLAAAGITPPQQAQPSQQAPLQGGVTRGQYGDGQHGEQSQGPTTPAGTFSGFPPQQAGVTQGQFPYTPEAIQEDLKKYPNLPPEVAAGVTPEMVAEMAKQGAADPVKAAIYYHTLSQGGSLTSATHAAPGGQINEKARSLTPEQKAKLPKVKSDADFAQLKSGDWFVEDDGNVWRKD